MNVQEALLAERIDPYLTVDNLNRLVAKCGISQEVTGHRILTGGCWNRVIAVALADGEEIVCKISPNERDDRIQREYGVLEAFAELTSMPVPEPLHLEAEGIIPGTALLMTMIEGKVMHQCFGLLSAAERSSVSVQIGKHVAELHRIRGVGFGGVELEPAERHSEWGSFWLPRFDEVTELVSEGDYVDAEMIDAIRTLRPRFSEAFESVGEPTFTHYDIWSGNVMLDPESGRVTGFIDIPGFYADYARELSFMMMFGVADRTFFDAYLEEHTLDPGFELRVNLYNLKMHLKHITMYPSESYYRNGAASCLEHLLTNLG